MSYGNDFNNQNMWEGQILLQDDGGFEGIAVDPNSSYTGDRFIFGVYYPEMVIELFKFTPLSVNAAFVFHGKRSVKGYDGQLETIGLLGTMPCGNSHIITQYAETVRQGIDEESQKLEVKIQRYKGTLMDETGKEFYENSIAMRRTMTESILRNYEGRGFTQEEIVELREEFEPVKERVMQSILEEAKSLVKQISKDSFSEELPF